VLTTAIRPPKPFITVRHPLCVRAAPITSGLRRGVGQHVGFVPIPDS
jgi:hypothetical protein